MSDAPPPFSALRALEAATRHKSFTWAARELNVTHSAVSQAVRRLEAELGTALFSRRAGAMEPSEEARRLAQTYSAAAHALQQALREISGRRAEMRLTVEGPERMATLWLADRRGRLAEALPDVDVKFVSPGAPDVPDLSIVEVDRAGDQEVTLLDLTAYPLCAPDLAKTLTSPEKIASARLLSEDPRRWSAWLRYHKLKPQGASERQADLDAALELAQAGQGVAIADPLSAHQPLAAGILRALPHPGPPGRLLVARKRAAPSNAEVAERFIMWLRLELARDAAILRRAGAPLAPGALPRS